MRALAGVSFVLILAITSVRAERLPNLEQVAVGVDVAGKTELGKILSDLLWNTECLPPGDSQRLASTSPLGSRFRLECSYVKGR